MMLRALGLYCAAGGSCAGLHRAGFTTVGVDVERQPHYPFEFHQDNALFVLDVLIGGGLWNGYSLDDFAFIWASPPCQFHSEMKHAPGAKAHIDLIPDTRKRLQKTGKLWTIENVRKAPLINPVTLCGSHFGLGAQGWQLQRHRKFEANFHIPQPKCAHKAPTIGVYGGHVRDRGASSGGRRTRDFDEYDKPALAREAMGIDWMTMNEMSQAIPPAYAEHIGRAAIVALAAGQGRAA